MFFTLMRSMSLLSELPLLGTPLALALLPTVTQIMMLAAVIIQHGGHLKPLPSWQLVRQRLGALLALGVLYALCFLAVMALSSVMDGGQFAQTYLSGQEFTQEMAESAEFRYAAGLALLLYIPLTITFWHAPGLVYWLQVPPIKALFFSLIACVRNVRAFVVYALVWVALLLGTGMAVSLVATLLTAIGVAAVWGQTLFLLSLIMASTMFCTSIVFTLRACFEPPRSSALEEAMAVFGNTSKNAD